MASRNALLLVGLWAVAAVGTTSVGVLAVQLVDNSVGEKVADPLTSTGVRSALSSVAPLPELSAEPVTRPTSSADDGEARTATTTGGVVSGRCTDGVPTLLYATPADGYRTERGTSVVRFVGRSRQVTVTLSCREDTLRVDTRTDPIGTAPSPTPAHTSRPPEPTDRPAASDSPESRDASPDGATDSSSGTGD